jgi:(R,R)-butanediol dehydrogenase / meso-butanediol dehydrogenase / diacetyl reductase
MKALQLYGHMDIRYEDVEQPRVQPGWSLLEVTKTSICKSDIKEYHGPLYISGKTNPLTGVSLPVTLGHEFSGRILELSEPHDSLSVGDRVAVDACIKCGQCWYCLHGDYVLCDKLAILGFDAHGSFAPQIAVPNYAMHRLPESVSDEGGALVEPIAVVTHAMRRGKVAVGDVVAVVGAGMIGLGSVAVARAAGASDVYVVEPLESRRGKARELGATAVFDPREGDPYAQLMDATGGHLADIVLDCVGTQSSLPLALSLARKGGRVVLVGVPTEKLTVDFMNLVVHQKEVLGSLCYVDDFPRAITLLADGRVPTDPFVTARIRLGEIIDEGFATLINTPEDHIRIMVDAQSS